MIEYLLLPVIFLLSIGVYEQTLNFLNDNCKHEKCRTIKLDESGKTVFKNICKKCGYTFKHTPIDQRKKISISDTRPAH